MSQTTVLDQCYFEVIHFSACRSFTLCNRMENAVQESCTA